MKKYIFLLIFAIFSSNYVVLNAETVSNEIVEQNTILFESNQYEALSGVYTPDNPYYILDPYGNSPLTGYVGFTSSQPLSLEIIVEDKNNIEDSFVFKYGTDQMKTEYFVPLLGLYGGYNNKVILNYTYQDGSTSQTVVMIQTPELPDNIGKVDITYANDSWLSDNKLYFDSIASGYHTGIDKYGEVRWYNSATDIFGVHFFEELNDGRLITQNLDADQYIIFDYNGRIYDFHTVDFRIEHDIQVLAGNNILVNSEDPRELTPTQDYTIEDQIQVINTDTWETSYKLDYRLLFDETRSPQPPPTPANEYESDWFHANSSVYVEAENMYVTSSRQQNIVVATDGDYQQTAGVEDISGIRWILGSPQTWETEDVYSLFLTPVDSNGNELYDLTDKSQLEDANANFFNWGQHSIYPVEFDDDINTFEFLLFDDGNYSSYDSNYWISPDNNTSRMVHYKVDESKMTVELVNEFGTELGNEYYSSFVGNVEYHEDTDTIMICFGGTNMDENLGVNVGVPIEVPLEVNPEYDYNENYFFIQEKTRVIEIDRKTNQVLFGYDHYNDSEKGLFRNFTYKAKQHELNGNYILIG